MSHPEFHARSSARRFGGSPGDYLGVHSWFDSPKSAHPDFRQRAVLHHAFGVFLAEEVFGAREEADRLRGALLEAVSALESLGESEHAESLRRRIPLTRPVTFRRKSDGREVPIRLVGEQHVEEDLGGKIPTLSDWLDPLPKESWMYRGARPLSREEL